MTTVVYAARALDDIERLADFLRVNEVRAGKETGELIISAIEILRLHPLVGRIAEHGLRELVISRGNNGYVALYRYDAAKDRAIILAIRHQREFDG